MYCGNQGKDMPRRKSREISEKRAREFEALMPILQSLLTEARESAKKEGDKFIGENKVKIINNVLENVKRVLAGEPCSGILGLLEGEKQSTYSDCVFVMTQYEAAMMQFKSKHFAFGAGPLKDVWVTRKEKRARRKKKKAKRQA
jgi:hypothetical protein